MEVLFEWDAAKAESNLAKHGVPFPVATQVFQDPGVIVIDATHVADAEMRSKAVGVISGRLFTVVFTKRVGTCRLISARRSNAQEARAYGSSVSP